MMKARFIRLAAVLIAIIVSISMIAPAAFAADMTDDATAVAVEAAVEMTKEEAVAQYRAEVLRLVNIEREKVGAAPLKEMTELVPLADVRAEESAQSFSHTRPNGTRCFTIFADNSIIYRAAGENLAYGFKTPEAVVTAWMNSEGHRKNILNATFQYIGIGYFENENGRIYTSQLFYTPKTAK